MAYLRFGFLMGLSGLFCFMALATFALLLMMLPTAGGESFEYELAEGEDEKKSLDVETSVSFETVLTNQDSNRQFVLSINNASSLQNKEHIYPSFDEDDEEQTSFTTQYVNTDNSVPIRVYINAKWNGLQGLHKAEIHASDVDYEETIILYLEFTINQNVSFNVVNLDSDKDGSTDTEENDGEYTYQLRMENTGNRADRYDVKILSSNWDTDLDYDKERVRAYHSHLFNITVTPERGEDYGSEDTLELEVSSRWDDEAQEVKEYIDHHQGQMGSAGHPPCGGEIHKTGRDGHIQSRYLQ